MNDSDNDDETVSDTAAENVAADGADATSNVEEPQVGGAFVRYVADDESSDTIHEDVLGGFADSANISAGFASDTFASASSYGFAAGSAASGDTASGSVVSGDAADVPGADELNVDESQVMSADTDADAVANDAPDTAGRDAASRRTARFSDHSNRPREVRSVATAASVRTGGSATAVADVPRKKRHVALLVVLVIILVLGMAAGGTAYAVTDHYSTRVLPGVTLWGRSMSGLTKDEVVAQINKAVADDTVAVTYDGKSAQVGLSDMGYTVDVETIAQSVMDAKRDTSVTQRYLSNSTVDVETVSLNPSEADPSGVGAKLGVESAAAQSASVALNEDCTAYEVTPAVTGTGVSVTNAAQVLIDGLSHFGEPSVQSVALEVTDITPELTTEAAQAAADKLNAIIAQPLTIKGSSAAVTAPEPAATCGQSAEQATDQGADPAAGQEANQGADAASDPAAATCEATAETAAEPDTTITTLGVDAVEAAVSVSPDDGQALSDGQTRVGALVFDANKLQDYYNTTVKPTYSTTEEDRDVIVNNDGDVLQTNAAGHPGVTVSDDSTVGVDGVHAMINGTNTVTIDASVTPMTVKQTKRHVIVDLSDRKLYAYENDELIRTFNVGVGSGIRDDGSCNGDMCTPTGDFKIWWKLPTQDMKGTLRLQNGTTTSWNTKGVKFINYFARSGCAIHRIATSTATNDADIAKRRFSSHGCVGIGWDVAEWFYGWCLYNQSVHIQE